MVSLTAALLLVAIGGAETVQPEGTVVDDKGQPLAGAVVMLSAWGVPAPDGSNPIVDRTTTDETGRFAMPAPPPEAFKGFASGTIWAFAPGLALGAVPYSPTVVRDPVEIRLAAPGNRVAALKRSDGSPVVGVKVAPASTVVRIGIGGRGATIPDALADLLAVVSDERGQVAYSSFAPDRPPTALRVWTHDGAVLVVSPTERVRDNAQRAEFLIEPAGGLAGRIRRSDGKSPAGLRVRIESGVAPGTIGQPVRFGSGPIRADADGRFQTPSGLLAGLRYRASLEAEGFAPAGTPWIVPPRVGETATLADLVLNALHEVTGRVVDRQGKPIAGAQVTQSGDGPARTQTRTDANGAFRLTGYSAPRGLVFAHAPGFRFGGRVVATGENAIVLTRVTEAPERPWPALRPALPAAELRALAKRALDPYFQAVMKEGDAARGGKTRALANLALLDPPAALDALAASKLTHVEALQVRIIAEFGRQDVDRATAVAEGLTHAPDRARALVAIADVLPPEPEAAWLAVLDKAVVHARAATNPDETLGFLGDVSDRLAERGEIDKAKPLLADGLAIARTLPDTANKRRFAAQFARGDLPAALGLIDTIPTPQARSKALANAAIRVAGTRPADCERLLESLGADDRLSALDIACHRMAPADPARARRLVEQQADCLARARARLIFASGLAKASKPDAEKAFREALDELDESFDDHDVASYYALLSLPLVEEIDPVLVPEALWHALSLRRSLDGRDVGAMSRMAAEVQPAIVAAHYDRDLAAALWAPLAQRLETSSPDDPFRRSYYPALVLAHLDPRAAVQWVESLPKSSPLDTNGQNEPRIVLSRLLAVWAQGRREPILPYHIGPVELLARRDLLR